MNDHTGTTLTTECKLRSALFGKSSTEIIYKGGNIFECPGGGIMYHDQESLLASEWVVVESPKKCKVK